MQCQKTHHEEILKQEEFIRDHLEQIFTQNGDQELMAGMDILHKLVTNIINNPHEEKFRIIKKTNAALQKKLFNLKGPLGQLLIDMGYVDMDEEHYAYVGEHFSVLLYAQKQIDQRITKIKVKYMAPEERKRWEMAEQSRILAKEEMEKKHEQMRLIKMQQEADRKEKAGEVVKPSVANELNFGANIVKFKPPEPRRG